MQFTRKDTIFEIASCSARKETLNSKVDNTLSSICLSPDYEWIFYPKPLRIL